MFYVCHSEEVPACCRQEATEESRKEFFNERYVFWTNYYQYASLEFYFPKSKFYYQKLLSRLFLPAAGRRPAKAGLRVAMLFFKTFPIFFL